MKRYAMQQLISWKSRDDRKPLLLQGARQVGKSWLMEHFGKENFDDYVVVDCELNIMIHGLFEATLDPRDIIHWIETYYHKKITENTLVIFDEIQACPKAITSLKYFCERAPKISVIAAGSLLGVALHRGISFPVGKVNSLHVYPMSFFEFLDAIGEEMLRESLEKLELSPFIDSFKGRIVDLLKTYFYVGGMPEAVKKYVITHNFDDVREIQNRILDDYKNDFSNHIPKELHAKVSQLWDSIPSQLAKENKKFVYRDIAEKPARAKDYESAISWLKDCGLIYQVMHLSKPAMPISAYQDYGIFKLYIVDIGLLCAKSNLDARVILDGDRMFIEYKGALTEQFVLQQLKTKRGVDVGYWSNLRGDAEVDFVIQTGVKIIPIEVKAGINLRAKSLSFYNEKFEPELRIRTSLADYKKSDNLYDIPLYSFEKFENVFSM